MSAIIDVLKPNALVLLNESFASTNSIEGSEVATQVITGLVDRGIRVLFVTHLFEFARAQFERRRQDSLFLRAERAPDGARTYRVVEGEPLATSYGRDLYNQVFTN